MIYQEHCLFQCHKELLKTKPNIFPLEYLRLSQLKPGLTDCADYINFRNEKISYMTKYNKTYITD